MALTRTGLFQRAADVIPGGVNSPVRAWGAVGAGEPFFAAHGEGAYLWDADGNRYVDWVMSWGPLVFGHADPEIVEAVQEAAAYGTTFGAPTEREVALAEELVDAVPSVEKVRLVSSGTEASMSALRLARGATGRDRILKFSGCYHGHADALLAAAGSGLATLGIPSSPGVPAGAAADTLVCPFNDVEAVTAAVERHGAELAAIIVEPVAGNMGVVPPATGFLEALRPLADTAGALLVFDEVITGFRVARGGAQELYGVTPDLTVLGKIAGGGLPLAAFGGTGHAPTAPRPVRVRGAGGGGGAPRGGPAGRGRRRGGLCTAGGCDGDPLLPRGAGGELRGRGRERHRALRRVVPAPARAGRLRGAFPVRGSLRLDRPRGGRDRRDGGGGA